MKNKSFGREIAEALFKPKRGGIWTCSVRIDCRKTEKREDRSMLASAFMMLVGSAFLMLRMGNSTGSFPKPLSAEEEKKYLTLWQEGDEEARNVLIEHNLRLVAHIVKNG